MDKWIELKRAPGTCCPEPTCDYGGFNWGCCQMCGKDCKTCKFVVKSEVGGGMSQKDIRIALAAEEARLAEEKRKAMGG